MKEAWIAIAYEMEKQAGMEVLMDIEILDVDDQVFRQQVFLLDNNGSTFLRENNTKCGSIAFLN